MRVSANEAKIIKAYRMGGNVMINFHNETPKSAIRIGNQFGQNVELSELMPNVLSGDFKLAPKVEVHLFANI